MRDAVLPAGPAHLLREIEGGLKSCEGKLAILGIKAPARSSLSYAKAHRPWQLFEQDIPHQAAVFVHAAQACLDKVVRGA